MGARRVVLAVVACATAAAFAAPAGAGAATAYPPTAIAVDGSGTSFVGDATTGQVRRYDRDGTYLGAWGTFGAGAGQIQGVVDLDVDSQGIVWVLEVRNRLQAYTSSGTFLREVQLQFCRRGTPVFAPGNGGVDATNEGVWVASPCNDKVTRYPRDLSAPDRDFVVAAPSGISVRNANVYVGRRGAGDVQVYNFSGQLQRSYALPAEPWDVFVDSFNVLHVSDLSNSVIRLLGSDGVEFRTLGRRGSNPGDLVLPYRFDVGEQGAGAIAGDIFIADFGNNRIQRWNSFGSTLFVRANDGVGAVPPVDPPPPPPPVGRTGVTINAAASFTNSRTVTLGIVAPAAATGVLLSNDGGFANAEARAVSATNQYAWTLASSGADRLPKQVYVRFTGGGVDEDKTFSDDIVLDQTAPAVGSATFRTVASAAAAKPAKGKAVRLTVRATDANSGVRTLAISSKPGGGKTLYVRNRRSLTVRLVSTGKVYVRAIDRADNAGRWKRATQKR